MCMRFALTVAAISLIAVAVTGCSLDNPGGLYYLGDLAHWKSKLGLGPSEDESTADPSTADWLFAVGWD